MGEKKMNVTGWASEIGLQMPVFLDSGLISKVAFDDSSSDAELKPGLEEVFRALRRKRMSMSGNATSISFEVSGLNCEARIGDGPNGVPCLTIFRRFFDA